MEKGKDLERELLSLDGRGYPGYKSLKGEYDFGSFIFHHRDHGRDGQNKGRKNCDF